MLSMDSCMHNYTNRFNAHICHKSSAQVGFNKELKTLTSNDEHQNHKTIQMFKENI
jgi:hypothetical protein